jgi:hypothetical protein
LLLLPSALGFLLPSHRQQQSSILQTQPQQNNAQSQVFSWRNEDNYCSSRSSLSMAFESNPGEESNIFDGPMALTKERDACGVGFIANTQSGG